MTRIAELLAAGPTYSFEFFPPKNDKELATLARTIGELQPLEPSFVSVTYRGGAESRQRTFDLVSGMLHTTKLNPMAHLICVAHTRLELADILVSLRKAGVENLMALGGDPPEDPTAGPGELAYATELVELAHAIGGFSVGVAAHPAGHPRSPHLESDRDYLAAKLELSRLRRDPVLLRGRRIRGSRLRPRGARSRQAGAAGHPAGHLALHLGPARGNGRGGAVVDGGAVARRRRTRWCRCGAQGRDRAGDGAVCRSSCALGVPGLHFYTFNASNATREIYAALGLVPAGVLM